MFSDRFLKKTKALLQKEVCEHKPPISLSKLTQVPVSSLPPIRFPKNNAGMVIAEGITVRGELTFQQELRINGTFEGTLRSEGKLIVGPCGIVRASLMLPEVEIYGRVYGNITVRHLILRKGALVEGDICALSLLIEEGAQVNGVISLNPKVEAIAIG